MAKMLTREHLMVGHSKRTAVSQWAARVGIVALVLAVRIPFFFWPLISDEGNYAYTAYWWLRGQPLYVDYLGLERAQALFLSYLVPVAILGGSTEVIRLWAGVWSAGTALTVYLMAERLFSKRAATVAALLFAVFSAAPHVEGFTANSETFMLLPLTLNAYFLLTRRPLLAGAMASLALLFKLSGAAAFALAVLWFLHERAGHRRWLLFVAGSAAVILIAFVHGALTAGPSDYLYNIVLFRLWARAKAVQNPFMMAISGWLFTAPTWLPLAVLAGFGIGRLSNSDRMFLAAWFCSSLLGAAMGGHWFAHYFLQFLPPLTVFAAAGLLRMWDISRLLTRLQVLAIPVICLVAFEVPLIFQSPRDGAWSLYHRHGYRVAADVAAYLRAHTTEQESIYVAFAEADIYYLAGRRSIIPQISRLQLLYSPGAYDRLAEAVQSRKPAYILVLDRPMTEIDPSGRLQKLLANGYQVEATFEGTPLFARRSSIPSLYFHRYSVE
jgi:hypothetical protein